MPPRKTRKTLTPKQIETLRKWIDEGATWGKHWIYSPPKKAPVRGNPIDHFIRERLKKEGLTPSKEADKATLLRRLSFDLTGLPPSPEEVTAFLADTGRDAYDSEVERLLKSPHYGERMAIFWLDLVRFANSRGYHSDNPRNVDPYRDWVIRAFNENAPFDRFTVEQLAGDLLPNSTTWQKVATCYNKLNQTTEEGGAQAKEYEAITSADRVRNASVVWMGATMGCSQCHDHKFDPYTMRDFYSFAAFFADIQERPIGDKDKGIEVPTGNAEARSREIEAKIAALRTKLEAPLPSLAADQKKWEAQARKNAAWVPLKPSKMTSSGGATLTLQDDGSIVAGGKNPDKDTYVLEVRTRVKKITAFRLEVLPDKALKASGPGRADNGNFVLGRFRLRAGRTEYPFVNPTASFEQKGYPVRNALDKKGNSGWAILPRTGKAHSALFPLRRPLTLLPGGKFTFTLEHGYGSRHAIGRFRLSVTNSKNPAGAKALPPEIAKILAIPAAKRKGDQKKRIAAR